MTSPEEETDTSDNLSLFSRMLPYLEKIFPQIWAIVIEYRFAILIALLAFWVKVAYTSSIDMWDEGWFAAIASRIAFGLNPSDPWLPLYYPSEGNVVAFFDKPPFSFQAGAILMIIFGRTTFAAKGIVILGGAGIAVVVYFLFSHQTENKSAAVVAGLLIALAGFLTFYSRTAYIDPFVIFMGALVMLLAIRAIDAVFVEDNHKKGYILLLLVFIVNILNILTKAWQGILTFPSIAIYLVFRYIERHVALENLHSVWTEIYSRFTLKSSDMGENLVENLSGIPIPLLITVPSLLSSFIISYIINQLILSSLLIAIIASIGFYLVFLRYCILKSEPLIIPGFIAGGISGFFAGIGGSLVVKIFFLRLADAFIEIGEAFFGEESIPWGPFEGILSFLAGSLSPNVGQALLLLEILAVVFGLVVTFIVVVVVSGIVLDFFTHKNDFIRAIYEYIDILPLGILGAWIGIWALGFLIIGLVFEREAFSITTFGVVVTIILMIIVFPYPKLKNWVTRQFNFKGRIRTPEELSRFQSNLIFLGIAIILVIISFYPFVAWIQYLDTNIANGTFPWKIRTPGELPWNETEQGPLTYTFLFFEYYISWRYTNATRYKLADSIGGAVNDYALWVMLPFFLVGIYAFFFSEKRNMALGSALIAWLVTVPFVFFPAQFQLNYYYIPLVIPFFAIAAKGIEFTYSYERLRLTVEDNVEKALAWIAGVSIAFSSVVIGFLFSPFAYVSTPVNLLTATILLVPFTFLTFRVLKTFPGIITAAAALRFVVDEGVHLDGLYTFLFHDLSDTIFKMEFPDVRKFIELGAPLVSLVGLILLIFGLYWLKAKFQHKTPALIILSLIFGAMLINVSVNAHYNQIFDLRYQEMAIYIKNHGGTYNRSTWVIPEGGTEFAMRYYLGYEIAKGSTEYPFIQNNTITMENYFKSRKNIKFWVIINNSKHWDIPAYAVNYSGAYRWFTTHEHLVDVDDIVGLTPWYKMHLFVNRTWITEQGYDWKKLTG